MKYLSLPRLLPLANLDLKISSPPATATCHQKTMKDPGIILFGKKIEFPETAMISSFPAVGYGLAMEEKTCSSINRQGHTLITPHDRPEDDSDDNPRTPSIDEETTPEKAPAAGTEGEPKALKKPDKILPCPRCESMDTKFCYYNNSNINQPRHFCKSCQRYWTAGGTMRNMPVGAGRRKKKNPASHLITITQEAFQSVAQIDSDAVHKVLSFGSNSNPNPPNFAAVVSGQTGDAGDDCSGGSTVTTSNSVPEKVQDKNGLLPSQVHWIQSPSWSYYPWNPATPFPIPATFPPGYPPVPIYPPPYWNSVSWLPPASSAPHFPILGKHSRDGESIKSNEKQKNSILTPKTLRIDDPDEAAMSSIWATLGIKNENSSRGDLFKAFQEKGAGKKKLPASTNSPAALQANPAALSRSLCFQERA